MRPSVHLNKILPAFRRAHWELPSPPNPPLKHLSTVSARQLAFLVPEGVHLFGSIRRHAFAVAELLGYSIHGRNRFSAVETGNGIVLAGYISRALNTTRLLEASTKLHKERAPAILTGALDFGVLGFIERREGCTALGRKWEGGGHTLVYLPLSLPSQDYSPAA